MPWSIPVLSARIKTILLLGVLSGVALLLWLRYAPSPPPIRTEPGPVTIAVAPKSVERIIEKIRVVQTPGPERIVYLDKPQLAAALKMPEVGSLSDNVIAVATIPEHSGPTTALATLSPQGEGAIIFRQEPPKFLQFKKEFGARAGMGTGGLVAAELYAHPLRVGPINVELRAFAQRSDARGSEFGGAVFLDYRF